MPRPIAYLFCCLITVLALVAATPAHAAQASTPAKFTRVKAVAGPGPGELTVSWAQSGKSTTGYRIVTALTQFSPSASSSLPRVGRKSHTFDVADGRSSVTLSAAQVAEAGAPLGSGVHLFLRVAAVNTTSAGTSVRWWPHLMAVLPEWGARQVSPTSASARVPLRVATFNVRTAKATSDVRSWLDRRSDVVDEITAQKPGVVAIQELGPGRADGKSGSTTGQTRQTTSLLDTLKAKGFDNYKLVRATPYVAPGTEHDTQGARILYDSNVVKVVSDCPESTGKKNYSPSCSVELPILASDTEDDRRSAAYAKFADRSTGATFYVISLHTDSRHDKKSTANETALQELRGKQVEAALAAVAKVNKDRVPVILGGDLNSWQNITVGDAPHQALVDAGFVDAASAPTRTKLEYPTVNHFDPTLEANSMGFGARLDGVYINGGGALSWENVTRVTDSARPSDHNLVVTDLLVDR